MCRESGTHGLEEGSWKSVPNERNNSLAAHPTPVTTPINIYGIYRFNTSAKTMKFDENIKAINLVEILKNMPRNK